MAGPDLSAVTAMVNFSTVVEAVLLVAAAWVYVYVAWKGAKKIIEAVRGGDGLKPYDELYIGNDGQEWSGSDLRDAWHSMDQAEQNAWGGLDGFLGGFHQVR